MYTHGKTAAHTLFSLQALYPVPTRAQDGHGIISGFCLFGQIGIQSADQFVYVGAVGSAAHFKAFHLTVRAAHAVHAVFHHDRGGCAVDLHDLADAHFLGNHNADQLNGTYKFVDEKLVLTFSDGKVLDPEADTDGKWQYVSVKSSGAEYEFVISQGFVSNAKESYAKVYVKKSMIHRT